MEGSKMKVVILVSFFPPEALAGTEIATYNIARHLAEKGYEIHIITSLNSELPQYNFEQGFFVHRISYRNIRFLGLPSYWLKIFLKVKKINPDVVHSQDVIMGIPGLIIKKLMRKPYLVWARGQDIYQPEPLFKYIFKVVIMNADFVVALTKNMMDVIQKNYDRRDVIVISNGIDLEKFRNIPKIIKRENKCVIYVGRFRSVKGLTYLIQAMKIINNHDSSIRLVLIGKGPEEAKLKNLVKELNLDEYIEFKGQIPNENIPGYLADSDVFVLPSLSEGFPNVVLEAMASGLPIVATRVTGLSEIILDGINGLLVEPGNSKEIARKILFILSNDDFREKIIENNKLKALDYSWENVITILEKIYIKMNSKVDSIGSELSQ